MTQVREKFTTQVDARVLRKVRKIAEKEGRQLQALMEEALTDLIEKRQCGKSRTTVMTAYLSSLERFGPLYKKLAE